MQTVFESLSDADQKVDESDLTETERASRELEYDSLRIGLGLEPKYRGVPNALFGPYLRWHETNAGYRCTALYFGRRDVAAIVSTFGPTLRDAWLGLARKNVIPATVACDANAWRTFVMLGRTS